MRRASPPLSTASNPTQDLLGSRPSVERALSDLATCTLLSLLPSSTLPRQATTHLVTKMIKDAWCGEMASKGLITPSAINPPGHPVHGDSHDRTVGRRSDRPAAPRDGPAGTPKLLPGQADQGHPVTGISSMSRVLGEEHNWPGKRPLVLGQHCLGDVRRVAILASGSMRDNRPGRDLVKAVTIPLLCGRRAGPSARAGKARRW